MQERLKPVSIEDDTWASVTKLAASVGALQTENKENCDIKQKVLSKNDDKKERRRHEDSKNRFVMFIMRYWGIPTSICANSHKSSRTEFLSIGRSACTRFRCRWSRSIAERPAGEGPWQTRGC
jgi:hypothetical protein